MQPQVELDVRVIPPPRRHPHIFATFDALAPGDAFVLLNDHYPKPLLYQFQVERPAQFEWNVLEAGPDRYRVEIRRRAADAASGVTEVLEQDHRRLDAMVPVILRAVAAGDLDEARARFAELRCGLDRHIAIEERILFPVVEKATGMIGRGPTVVMRAEHVELRAALAIAGAALAAGDAAAAEQAIQALVAGLGPHNLKEERILYPMSDEAMADDDARGELVRRMQAV